MLQLKLFVGTFCVVYVACSGYGGSGYGGGGHTGTFGRVAGRGFGNAGFGGNFNGLGGALRSDIRSGGGLSQVVPAAIQTRHQIDFRDVPSSGSVTPTVVEVGANSVPLQILFRSSSSSLNVQQSHDGAGGGTQESSSEDEPHRLFHSVRKPIIQEVHEVITPFRKITQQIEPVQEEIQTIVARGTGSAAGGGAPFVSGGFGNGNGGFGGNGFKSDGGVGIRGGFKSGGGFGGFGSGNGKSY